MLTSPVSSGLQFDSAWDIAVIVSTSHPLYLLRYSLTNAHPANGGSTLATFTTTEGTLIFLLDLQDCFVLRF